MTDWQALISATHLEQFLRTGKMMNFRLARNDLVTLCAQVMKREPESVRADIDAGPGVVAIRCVVRCEPLDRAVIVDEWTEGS